jgi:VWFA-related protein
MKPTALLLVLLAQSASQPTFKSGVNFVEVDVIVTDRAGVPVRGLRRQDFEVFEDGKPVEVTTFTAVDLPAADPAAAIPPADRSGTALASNDQAEDGRVMLVVMDDYHVSFDAGRAASSRAIARKLVERMGPSDLAAVVSTSGRQNAQTEFTSDKPRLIEAIGKFFPQSEYGAGGVAAQAGTGRAGGRGAGSGFGFVNEIKARWAMDTLSKASTTLATIPHRRKAILLVSQGLPYSLEEAITNPNATGAFQAFRDFILTAQRNNIAIYPMDPCGLDLDQGCSTDSRQNLQSLAENTGGFAVINTNAPEQSIDRMIAENGSYYLVGYDSPAPPYDGKRHRIKVRIREQGLTVRARDGYVSPRKAPKTATGMAPIDALIGAPIQSRGLTMKVAAVPAPLAEKPGATVAVGIEVPSADAVRARSIEFTVIAVDANGDVRTRQRFTSNFQATATAPTGWTRLGSRVDVPPGSYQIRVAAVGADGPGGSVFTEVVVPKFTDDLALGGLSLGSPALPTVKRAEPLSGVLPLLPLATREFSGTSQIVAQLPVRASARADGPITLDARLSREDGTAVPLPAASATQRDFSGPAGAVHQVALPPRLEPGVYRLIIGATLGRERKTREIAFRIAPGP